MRNRHKGALSRSCGILPIRLALMILTGVLTVSSAAAQTFTTIAKFSGTNGSHPYGALMQASDGNIYGTTYDGGAYNAGTVFRIDASDALTTIYNFCSQPNCSDGSYLLGGLVEGADGNLYGVTVDGGSSKCQSFGEDKGCGTIFQITPSGALTTLHQFCSEEGCPDGEFPVTGLTRGADGDFYGTTEAGGSNSGCSSALDGCGTIFKISSTGAFTILASFSPSNYGTQLGSLTESVDGRFFGTTQAGGISECGLPKGCGTVYSISPSGALATIYQFCAQYPCPDGFHPFNGVIVGSNGNLYGSTVFGPNMLDQGLFQMTTTGVVKVTHSVSYIYGEIAGLIQGSDQNFYATAWTTPGSTVLKISSNGVQPLYKFCRPQGSLFCLDGDSPLAPLFQATDGKFYGTAYEGGISDGGLGYGTVFSLSVGLKPMVLPQPAWGTVGTPVRILGSDLSGSTSVTFNGTPAEFIVVSKSLITTTVPAGATSGFIQVATPDAKLKSSSKFMVNP